MSQNSINIHQDLNVWRLQFYFVWFRLSLFSFAVLLLQAPKIALELKDDCNFGGFAVSWETVNIHLQTICRISDIAFSWKKCSSIVFSLFDNMYISPSCLSLQFLRATILWPSCQPLPWRTWNGRTLVSRHAVWCHWVKYGFCALLTFVQTKYDETVHGSKTFHDSDL